MKQTSQKSKNQLLAESLAVAKSISREDILKSSDLDRTHRERLMRSGSLLEIIKGWYLLTKPGSEGSSTAWYGGFWSFMKCYLGDRFGDKDYCLSPESSLDLLTGETKIPDQLVVITKKASNQTVELPFGTFVVIYTDNKYFPETMNKIYGINVMSLPYALCRVSHTYFHNKPHNIEIAIKAIGSVTEISKVLVTLGATTSAERIAGAYLHMQMPKESNQIVEDMKVAGVKIKTVNPFENTYNITLNLQNRFISPYVTRIEAMWERYSRDIKTHFPSPNANQTYKSLNIIQDLYIQDAYHSLSIEGYRVTEDLIEQIAIGGWDPQNDEKDKQHYDAMAAKGYFEAFGTVKTSLEEVFAGADPGIVFENDLQKWYRALFLPFEKIGIMKASDLIGYRDQAVYIKNSKHVPPPREAVIDAMECFFHLLKTESDPAVRVVLGHFIFVFIHPFSDGNGRIARFLMNLMLVTGGYNWTVVRFSKRTEYMKSLEEVSVNENIIPFTKLIAEEMDFWKKTIDEFKTK